MKTRRRRWASPSAERLTDVAAVDPKGERIAKAVEADRGLPVGVTAFRNAFAQEASAKAYSEWLNHPVTRLFRGAVQDLLMNAPAYGISTDMLPVHHGMTVAFATVAQLLENPGLVLPGMFTLKDGQSAPKPLSEIDDGYSVSPDDALDTMKD